MMTGGTPIVGNHHIYHLKLNRLLDQRLVGPLWAIKAIVFSVLTNILSGGTTDV